jgi:ABC-type protease/lipase transport system fused ATPase/permease subunit
MDFKLVSKNNIGAFVLLLLIIALSQAKAFNFLIDSALGRFFLIIFILSLSYCHKIIGVVGVLFIIIMFNSNMYYEGFGNISTDASGNSTSIDASGNSTSSLNSDQIKQMIQEQIQQKMSSNNTTTSTTDTSHTSDTTKKSKNSKNTEAAEGFDILGLENNIKRGKQSNSIPVNNLMRDSDSILPYEGSSFLGSFSPF